MFTHATSFTESPVATPLSKHEDLDDGESTLTRGPRTHLLTVPALGHRAASG